VSERLRVLTVHSLPYIYNVGFGQRNATFIRRRLTPLAHVAGWAESFAPVPERGYDLVHSFNAVPVLTRRPYVVTFESFLPRLPSDQATARTRRARALLEARLRRRLARDRCVALLAMSRYAVRQLEEQTRDAPELPALRAKLRVRYPALPLRAPAPRGLGGELRLLLVGHRYFAKGGAALLRAHERLRSEGANVTTTVLSSLQWDGDDYIGPPDRAFVDRELRRLDGPGVRVLGHMPRERVLELMEHVDFLVLPTFADTFGYVTIEALAGATPVIATDTCALGEIVDDGRNGYLLPFANDGDVGRWAEIPRRRLAGYQQAFEEATERTADALVERLRAVLADPPAYERLSQGAIDVVRERFDVTAARDELEELYERCRR
jgi:glycosyltransferase involved in cell wall biosynthesis